MTYVGCWFGFFAELATANASGGGAAEAAPEGAFGTSGVAGRMCALLCVGGCLWCVGGVAQAGARRIAAADLAGESVLLDGTLIRMSRWWGCLDVLSRLSGVCEFVF